MAWLRNNSDIRKIKTGLYSITAVETDAQSVETGRSVSARFKLSETDTLAAKLKAKIAALNGTGPAAEEKATVMAALGSALPTDLEV